ncbi:hypothetical protein [Chengkuizengella marina]|uniref:Uncharacterized protein n=1 Tax=Chengkuizengella marina TaxID=2507566 RepID=A0A6N9Q7V5_9BACL|nr:hypothetical protein [Chengkuizengella marina]NBI30995.1 hypothetical protein [Chengkuizengella marina]
MKLLLEIEEILVEQIQKGNFDLDAFKYYEILKENMDILKDIENSVYKIEYRQDQSSGYSKGSIVIELKKEVPEKYEITLLPNFIHGNETELDVSIDVVNEVRFGSFHFDGDENQLDKWKEKHLYLVVDEKKRRIKNINDQIRALQKEKEMILISEK